MSLDNRIRDLLGYTAPELLAAKIKLMVEQEASAREEALAEALREAVEVWASHLNLMPNVRSRARLDEVRAIIGD